MTALALKILGGVLLLAALVGGTIWVLNERFDAGVLSGKNAQIALEVQNKAIFDANSLKTYADATKTLNFSALQAQKDIQTGDDNVQIQIKTITQVKHDNPDYAAFHRPDAADGVRRASLEAVRAAIRGTQAPGTVGPGTVSVP